MSAVLFLGFKVVSATDFELIENEKKSRYIWFVEDDSDKGENKIYLGEKLYGKVYNDKDIKVKISNLINSVGLKEDGTIDESLNYDTIIEWLRELESNNESLREKLEEEKEKLNELSGVTNQINEIAENLENEIDNSDKSIAYAFNRLKEKIGLTDELELPEDFGDTIIDKINEVSEKIVFASKEDIENMFNNKKE